MDKTPARYTREVDFKEKSEGSVSICGKEITIRTGHCSMYNTGAITINLATLVKTLHKLLSDRRIDKDGRF